MTVLLGLVYSPWTERARFALDARAVPYRFQHYSPVVGEPALRRKLGRWRGRVTVPVMFDGDLVLADSVDIARWADERGAGPALFPRAHEGELGELVELAEQGASAGRVVSLSRIARDREALVELVPRKLRTRLGPLAPRIGSLAIRMLQAKYSARDTEGATRTLRSVLDRLRTLIAASPSRAAAKTIFEELTFADIAMAQVIVSLSPPPFGLRLGAASARAFCDARLRDEYGDLVAWRDALYEAYRPRS